MRSTILATPSLESLFDAVPLIGAPLDGDPRHMQAYPRVEAARTGPIRSYTATGPLSEVYAALTWEHAQPRHSPAQATQSMRELIEPPGAFRGLPDRHAAAMGMANLAAKHGLTAWRMHDAPYAALALVNGVTTVDTYNLGDWKIFAVAGFPIAGPASTPARLHLP